MTNIAAEAGEIVDDLETEAKSASDYVREAFDHAKEAVKMNLAKVDEDEHYLALGAITAFLEHLAKSAETAVKDAAITIRNLFEEVV